MKNEELIGAYFDGSTLNLERILDDYEAYIVTIIRNFGNLSQEDEEEIISDVFLVIWKNKDKLNKNLKFSPYIAGITRKIICKKFRQVQSEFDIEDYEKILVSKFNVDKIIEEKDINNWIIENVKKLGEKEYQIFTKFYYEDKKVKTIAKELGLSSSNVKTTLHRTREKVKKLLNIGGFNRYE